MLSSLSVCRGCFAWVFFQLLERGCCCWRLREGKVGKSSIPPQHNLLHCVLLVWASLCFRQHLFLVPRSVRHASVWKFYCTSFVHVGQARENRGVMRDITSNTLIPVLWTLYCGIISFGLLFKRVELSAFGVWLCALTWFFQCSTMSDILNDFCIIYQIWLCIWLSRIPLNGGYFA